MKISRLYTLDVNTVELLKRKKNKSKIVNRAIQMYLQEDDYFSLADVPTRNILAALTTRDDVPDHIQLLIKSHLTK
jgi:hypothetical protein